MILEKFGLQQTRYMTKGKSVEGAKPPWITEHVKIIRKLMLILQSITNFYYYGKTMDCKIRIKL